jgi:RNA polymerase sigma-70 factor (ECF subfamily)
MIGPGFAYALAAASAGDEAAFAAIWRDLHPRLQRYLRVVAGDAGEDLASETWAVVATTLDRFEGDERAFRAWVFTVARRRAVDNFRRAARRPSVPVDPVTLHEVVDDLPGADPADCVLASISTDEALSLVASLPTDQAEAVALRAIGGLDVATVAVLMDKRPGTVRVLTHRGLRSLAARIPRPAPEVAR